MSYVTLPKVRKMQLVHQGYTRCDGCQKRLKGSPADGKHATVYFIEYRGSFDVGLCCEPRLIETLRAGGFKFRLRPWEKKRRKP